MDKTLDLDELERVAREATPGPWALEDAAVRSPGGIIIGDFTTCPRGTWEHDAAYLDTFDPPTILSLIAAARQQETVISDEVVERMCAAYVDASFDGADFWSRLTDEHHAECRKAMRAALSLLPRVEGSFWSQPSRTAQEPPSPKPYDLEGWKLVPVEPTEAMLEAGSAVRSIRSTFDENTRETFRAMLAAAPHSDGGA